MSIPVDLDRDEARDLALRELADPRYESEPPLWQRALEWLIERVSSLLDQASDAIGGTIGAAVLAVIVLVLAVILMRYGPLARRAATGGDPLFGAARRTSRDYRAAADAAAAESRWGTAVVERYRAVVATLEERSVLDPRPGRTADEAARDAGVVLPDLSERLAAAAAKFDAVHYGGQDATATDYEQLRDLDGAVQTARPRQPAPELAVPR